MYLKSEFRLFSKSGSVPRLPFLLGQSSSKSPLNSLGVLWRRLLLDGGWTPSLPQASAPWTGLRVAPWAQALTLCLKRKNCAQSGSWLWASLAFWAFHTTSSSPVFLNRCFFFFWLFYSQKTSVKKVCLYFQTSLQFGFLGSVWEVVDRSARGLLPWTSSSAPDPLLCRRTPLSVRLSRTSCDALSDALLLIPVLSAHFCDTGLGTLSKKRKAVFVKLTVYKPPYSLELCTSQEIITFYYCPLEF